jgi:hypothetical protein
MIRKGGIAMEMRDDVRQAAWWGLDQRKARYFSFFGVVEAPESEHEDEPQGEPIWQYEGRGIWARAFQGPVPGTAVLETWSLYTDWSEVGLVYWPPKFLGPADARIDLERLPRG